MRPDISVRAVVALLVLLAAPLRGQTTSDETKSPWCDEARTIVETGEPSDRQVWAFNHIHGCSPAEAGKGLAKAVARLSQSRDTALLRVMWMRARNLDDANLYTAGLNVVQDPTATLEARLYGVIGMIYTLAPGNLPRYESVLNCGDGRHTVGNYREVGVPLPTDFTARAQAVARAVAQDPGAPKILRDAMICLQYSRR